MTGYSDDFSGLAAMGSDFVRLRGRLEALPFHFINLGVLAYIGTGQVRPLEEGKMAQEFPILYIGPFFIGPYHVSVLRRHGYDMVSTSCWLVGKICVLSPRVYVSKYALLDGGHNWFMY